MNHPQAEAIRESNCELRRQSRSRWMRANWVGLATLLVSVAVLIVTLTGCTPTYTFEDAMEDCVIFAMNSNDFSEEVAQAACLEMVSEKSEEEFTNDFKKIFGD